MEKIRIDLIKEEYKVIVLELLAHLKAHSEETFKHSFDVAEKAYALANALGVKGDDLSKLYIASLVHDIGKLYIDEKILHKQNATDAERELIKKVHIEGTKQILDEYFEEDIVSIAFNHHERLDGSGYPDHFTARKLDILDRILQVADVTSALLMSRSYKDAYAAEQVVSILDNLVKSGELDKKCVLEIEKLFLEPLKNQSQKI